VDHIATVLSLAVDGPVHKAAIKFLALAYSQQEAEAIWMAWAPHLAPPTDHPLAGGTPLRDTILQALCTPYPTTKQEREATDKLVEDIAKAVATQTFVAHKAADLPDEEMEVIPHPSHFVQVWSYLPPPPLTPWNTLHNMPNPSKGDPHRGFWTEARNPDLHRGAYKSQGPLCRTSPTSPCPNIDVSSCYLAGHPSPLILQRDP